MSDSYTFFAPGKPAPQGSKKVHRYIKGRAILGESSAAVDPWRKVVAGCARRLHLNLFANCRKLYFPDLSSARKHRRTRTCIIILCKTANAPRAASSASWCPCRRCRRSHRPLAGALAVVSPRISVARLPVAVKLLELSAQTALGQTPRSQRAQGLHTMPQSSVLLGALLLMCSTRIESHSRTRERQNCR